MNREKASAILEDAMSRSPYNTKFPHTREFIINAMLDCTQKGIEAKEYLDSLSVKEVKVKEFSTQIKMLEYVNKEKVEIVGITTSAFSNTLFYRG